MNPYMPKIDVDNYPLVKECQGDIIKVLPISKPFAGGIQVLSGWKGGQSPIATKDAPCGWSGCG